MKNEFKDVIITVGFVIILVVILLANVLNKEKEISITERRKLAQFPEISLRKIMNGEVTKKLEKYVADQFAARETFKKIKSNFNTRNIKTARQ